MRQIKSFVRFRTPARRGNALRRSLNRFLLAALVGTVLAGCMTTSRFMTAKSQTARNDVFSEADEKGAIPNGYADLEISASIKTHTEGFYLLESRDSLHGKKGYPFVLNIDGQAVVWKVDGREETIPIYFEKGGRNPEGGTGVKYEIQKKIRLAAGSHRMFFGLPAEDYYREFDVTLTAGRTYALTFEPVYKQRIPGLQRIPNIRSFTNGFDRYEKVWTKIRPDPGHDLEPRLEIQRKPQAGVDEERVLPFYETVPLDGFVGASGGFDKKVEVLRKEVNETRPVIEGGRVPPDAAWPLRIWDKGHSGVPMGDPSVAYLDAQGDVPLDAERAISEAFLIVAGRKNQ